MRHSMKRNKQAGFFMAILASLALTGCNMLNPFHVEPMETTVPETTIPIEAVAETAEDFGVNSTASNAFSIGFDRSPSAVSMLQLMASARDGKAAGHYTIVPETDTEKLVNDFREKKLDIAIVSPETAATLFNSMGQQVTVLDINTYSGSSEQNKDANQKISGVAIAQNGFLKLHREDAGIFVREHAVSIQNVSMSKEYVASLMVRSGICSTTADGLSIINSNTYRCEIGDTMKQKLNAYYAACDLSALGGAIPGEAFYTGPSAEPQDITAVETLPESESETETESTKESDEDKEDEREDEEQEYYPGEAPNERNEHTEDRIEEPAAEKEERKEAVVTEQPAVAQEPAPVMPQENIGPGMGITPDVVQRRLR